MNIFAISLLRNLSQGHQFAKSSSSVPLNKHVLVLSVIFYNCISSSLVLSPLDPLRRLNLSFVFQTGPLLKVTKGTNELLCQANCHKPRISQANSDIWPPSLQNFPLSSLGCLSSDSFSSIYSLNVSRALLCCWITSSPCVTLSPATQSPSVNNVFVPILHIQTQPRTRGLYQDVLEATPHL